MARGVIISFSRERKSKGSWLKNLYDFEMSNEYADYWGERVDDGVRATILDGWVFKHIVLDRTNECMYVGSFDAMMFDMRMRLQQLIDNGSSKLSAYKEIVTTMSYYWVIFFDEETHQYYTYTDFMDFHAGDYLYVNGMYNFHH